MKVFNKDIKLVIFDLDGTLIDSTSLWGDIDKAFFERRGREVPDTYSKDIAHLGLSAAAKYTRDNYFPNENIKDMMDEWTELSIEAYAKHIPLKEGAKELLELLKTNGVIITLATANSKELYEPCLKRLKIDNYFSMVIDVNSCKEGKNSPELYDRIRQTFNVKANETLIFEDSILAMKTAFNSGYNVIAVYDKHSERYKEDAIKQSHLYVMSLNDVIKMMK